MQNTLFFSVTGHEPVEKKLTPSMDSDGQQKPCCFCSKPNPGRRTPSKICRANIGRHSTSYLAPEVPKNLNRSSVPFPNAVDKLAKTCSIPKLKLAQNYGPNLLAMAVKALGFRGCCAFPCSVALLMADFSKALGPRVLQSHRLTPVRALGLGPRAYVVEV